MASVRGRPSIRAHLLQLALVVSVPLVALDAWNLYDAAQADVRQVRRQVHHLAQITASETAKFLGQAHNIVKGLAARPAVRALDSARCDPMLKDLVAIAPRFSNMATMSLDGRVICSAVPLVGPAYMDPDRFLKLLRGPEELTVGRPTPGTVTKRWAIPVGVPIHDDRGRLVGALGLAVDLASFPVLPALQGLSTRAVGGLVAGDGTVLAHSKEPGRFIGTNQNNQPATRIVLWEKDGTAEETDIDGVQRVLGFAPVPGTDWIAVASLPASEVYAGVRSRIAKSALAAVALLGASLLLAARWSREIREPISALARTASDVAAGNLAARAPVLGSAEVAEVATQFNRMLDARVAALKQLRESEEKLRRLIDGLGPSMFVGLLTPQGKLLTANQPALAAAGLRLEDVQGLPVESTYWFAHSHEVQRQLRKAVDQAARGTPSRFDIQIQAAGGPPVWLDFSMQLVRDEAGEVAYLVPSAMVITERKQAETELRVYGERLRHLSQHLLEIEESERRSLNRELHDRIGQSLSTLVLNLKLLLRELPPDGPPAARARIEDAQGQLQGIVAHVRNLMADLHPPGLDDFGLLAALRNHAQAFSARVGIPVAVKGGDPEPRLPRAVELTFFRIAQEALNNAAKHAGASRIELEIASRPGRVALSIADDGDGFAAGGSDTPAKTWGITIMRERAEAAGAVLRIESEPGRGTRVVAELVREAA